MASAAVGRHPNHAFVGASGSGKTFAAVSARYRLARQLTVFVDPTGNVDEGVPLDEILLWLHGPMGDPRRGGHRVWNASGWFSSGDLAPGFGTLARKMQELGAETRRRSTLILDEVGDITISSRKAGRKQDYDVIRELIRVSKTGRHTGVSAWAITQRVQELPPNMELEFRNIFSVGDQKERRYYEREIGSGRNSAALINALDVTERARTQTAAADRPEWPYVALVTNPSNHLGHGGPEGALRPCGRVLLCEQVGGGGWPVMTREDWQTK